VFQTALTWSGRSTTRNLLRLLDRFRALVSRIYKSIKCPRCRATRSSRGLLFFPGHRRRIYARCYSGRHPECQNCQREQLIVEGGDIQRLNSEPAILQEADLRSRGNLTNTNRRQSRSHFFLTVQISRRLCLECADYAFNNKKLSV
jgi:hypothetical protein